MKLASRENRTTQGEGVFVIRAQARTAYRKKALRYDGAASGRTVNTYQWNARNQLTQVSQNGVAQLSYTYDALGRRTSKTVQGTATQFLYDGANAVQETQGGSINAILTGLGIDERFARNDVTGRTYFLTDALNSTIALTDLMGTIKQQYSYDPYGGVTPSDTTTGFTNPYQYTGREADAPGLYYYRARYYSPMMGGFISEDPITFGGAQLSFYAYVGGNPLNNIDPFGLRPLNACEKCALSPYIPKQDLDNANLHDGEVPGYLPKGYDGITRGNNIYFRPGVYDPCTPAGIAVLGHELVHVGQYSQGMTWISYLWSTRNGYESSKYEQPAYAMQDKIQNDLTKNGLDDCGCQK